MKKAFGVILAITVVVCFYFAYFTNTQDGQEEYCRKVNSLVCNEKFVVAKIEDSKIILYASIEELLKEIPFKEIPFKEFDKTIKIKYIRKENMITYFILEGSIDDESGIMFINDDSNRIFDGIKSITRIGGNSYQYNTAE
ncbi:MAG: hypothetical protein E7429_07280 [Ruminococcaceae bacterium]|nr:hypothetical protein [Oscillospiraceae bacterium]